MYSSASQRKSSQQQSGQEQQSLELTDHPEAAALFTAHTFLGSFLIDYLRPIDPLPDNAHLRFVLDNKIVTTNIEWTFDTKTSPFDYLKTDYDIIQAIQQENMELQMEPNVSWVKGHQDRDRMWVNLTAGSQSNCLH